ncbi:MAG: hypothetical protein IIB00_04030 [candidate division Zixibacteria bacterium]|nr:hypothetical protein [candidate division Zixibacteria bacterium]
MNDPSIPDFDETSLTGSETDEGGNSLFVAFAYIPVLCLIPILSPGQDANIRFHTRQGLILFLIEIVSGLFLIPWVSSLIWKSALIVCIGLSIAGIVFALQGKRYKLPIIGDWAEKIKI